MVRWALLAADLLMLDIVLLSSRFILQPCRVLAMLSMVRRVRRMQKHTTDISFNELQLGDVDGDVAHHGSILTPSMREQLKSHTPDWCQNQEWHLAFSTRVHGSSMQAFYECVKQVQSNLIIVRDGYGGVFGGFTTQGWYRSSRHYYDTNESFVFSSWCDDNSYLQANAIDGSSSMQLAFYHAAAPSNSVILWGKHKELILDTAIALKDNLRCGTSAPSLAFGSPELAAEGLDFSVSDFECWHVGPQESNQ